MNVCKVGLAAIAAGLVGLSAPALVVDRDMTITTAPDGNVEFAGDYTLTVAADMFVAIVSNNGHHATLRLDSKAQIRWIDGSNGSYTRVEFNGGALTDAAGWGGAWFKPDATSTIELASIDGKPIQILHPNAQWQYLSSGAGKIITSGTGRFEVATGGLSGSQILYCYLNIPSANYGHTGGTLPRGNTTGTLGNIAFNSINSMPRGEVSLGDSSGYKCRVFMGATSHYADRIIGYSSSYLTNQTSSACSLTFTNDNSCLDAVLSGPSFNVTMNGAQPTDVFTLKTPRVSGVFTVQSGKAVVQTPRAGGGTYCGQLRVCAGTTLEVDGVALSAGIFMNEGGQVVYKNGGSLTITEQVDAGSRLFDTDGAHLAGSSSFVKSGAGTLYLSGDSCLEAAEYRVAGGTMKFVGPTGTTNHWWRFTARQSATAGGPLSIGPMRLLDANCDFADGAGTGSGGGGYTAVAADVSPATYQAKEYYCSSSDYYKGAKTGSDNPQGPNTIWNSSSVYDCTFKSPKPTEADPSTWITWTYRIATANVTIRGYNLKTQWGTGSCWPRSWKLESSPSGADGTWVLMDERSGYTAIENGQKWYNGGGLGVGGNDQHPSTKINFDGQGVPSLASQGGVAAGVAVRVDRGATLDCSQCAAQQELSALTVDCATGSGVGTLRNVRLAATGTIRLLNATGKSGVVLPLAFVDSVTTGSLAGWTVCVNGVENPKLALAWQDGRLVIPKLGLAILVK